MYGSYSLLKGVWFLHISSQLFDGKEFSPKNSPLACQPFAHKQEDEDDQEAGTSGAAALRTFDDVEKIPNASTVASLKAKVVNLSPKKPVRGGASYFRVAGLQDVKGQRNAINLFGTSGDDVEAGKVIPLEHLSCNNILRSVQMPRKSYPCSPKQKPGS